MRVGQNPAKRIPYVAKPERVTVAVITYIPFLGGYYAQSLDVLKVCLKSIWENTEQHFDLMIFDNASCEEVRAYLVNERNKGNIRYLILSDKNIGKAGAWNFIFQAAPGEYIAYADSDVYHYPKWLSALVKDMDLLPKLGMLTGMPLRSSEEYSTATLDWSKANPDASLEVGSFLPWEDFWKHARSLGADETEMRARYAEGEDIRLTYQHRQFYVGAGHFQFMTRKDIIQQVLPIPSRRPMGEVRLLDIALNDAGFLRLSTKEWHVQHIGNQLSGTSFERELGKQPSTTGNRTTKRKNKFLNWHPVRRILQGIYHWIFKILYIDQEDK